MLTSTSAHGPTDHEAIAIGSRRNQVYRRHFTTTDLLQLVRNAFIFIEGGEAGALDSAQYAMRSQPMERGAAKRREPSFATGSGSGIVSNALNSNPTICYPPDRYGSIAPSEPDAMPGALAVRPGPDDHFLNSKADITQPTGKLIVGMRRPYGQYSARPQRSHGCPKTLM